MSSLKDMLIQAGVSEAELEYLSPSQLRHRAAEHVLGNSTTVLTFLTESLKDTDQLDIGALRRQTERLSELVDSLDSTTQT